MTDEPKEMDAAASGRYGMACFIPKSAIEFWRAPNQFI
jgi:hypothetical protein